MEKSALISEIEKTSNRASIYYNNDSIDRVFYEGNIIWEKDNKPYRPANLDELITKTGGSARSWAENAYESRSNGTTITNRYCYSSITGWSKWVGVDVYAEASWSGIIDLTKLPDYTSIKKVKIYRYGYGAYEVLLAEGQTIISVSDYKYGHDKISCYDPHFPADVSQSATAGISNIEYFYA